MRAQNAETQDHNQQEVYPPGRKFRMWSYSTRRLNSDTSRITLCSLNLPRINSTVAQESRGNHRPSLPRTQARGTCRLGSLLQFFCTSECAHPRFLGFPTLVHALVINRYNVKLCAVVQRARHPTHHTRDGCVLARMLTEVGAVSTANAVEQNTFRDSQRVACPSVGPRRIPRGRRERSRGGGGCIHQLRAQVLGGPAREKEITSVDERWADATRWSCGADFVSKTDTIISSQICRDISSSVETPLPMSSRTPLH